jgi:hypothetical protein
LHQQPEGEYAQRVKSNEDDSAHQEDTDNAVDFEALHVQARQLGFNNQHFLPMVAPIRHSPDGASFLTSTRSECTQDSLTYGAK